MNSNYNIFRIFALYYLYRKPQWAEVR